MPGRCREDLSFRDSGVFRDARRKNVSGERVQEQEKGTGWAPAIFAYALLLRTLQLKILPGPEHIGVNTTWSLRKQSLKYLAIFKL